MTVSEFNKTEYYFKLTSARLILASMPTTSVLRRVLDILNNELHEVREHIDAELKWNEGEFS